MEQLCEDSDLWPKTAAERTAVTKEHMRELNRLFIHGKQPSKLLAKNIAKYILSRSGLLVLGGVVLLTATTTRASAAEISVARRLSQNPQLFIDATPDELTQLENSELTAQTAREIAQLLHEAAQSAAAQQTQKDLQKSARTEIIKSLQTVRAR